MKFNMRYPRLFRGVDLRAEVEEIKKYLRELVDEIRRAFNGDADTGVSVGSSGGAVSVLGEGVEWIEGTELFADPGVIFAHTAFAVTVDGIPVHCLRSGSMIYGSLSVCTDTEKPTFKHYAVQISCAADGVLTLLCSHYSDGETGIITALNALI